MSQAPTRTGSAPVPPNPSSKAAGTTPARRRAVLPIERQHVNDTFRSERSPAEIELETIEAEIERAPSGQVAHG